MSGKFEKFVLYGVPISKQHDIQSMNGFAFLKQEKKQKYFHFAILYRSHSKDSFGKKISWKTYKFSGTYDKKQKIWKDVKEKFGKECLDTKVPISFQKKMKAWYERKSAKKIQIRSCLFLAMMPLIGALPCPPKSTVQGYNYKKIGKPTIKI